MILKTAKHQYFFETSLQRQEGHMAVLTADDIKDSILVATAAEFTGGVAGCWSPEQLFLASLNGSMMTTYLAIAEKQKLLVAHFECNAIGQVQLSEDHLAFTVVNLFPKIYVRLESEIPPANEVLLKTYKHCIVANSVNCHLVHHGEVLLADGNLKN